MAAKMRDVESLLAMMFLELHDTFRIGDTVWKVLNIEKRGMFKLVVAYMEGYSHNFLRVQREKATDTLFSVAAFHDQYQIMGNTNTPAEALRILMKKHGRKVGPEMQKTQEPYVPPVYVPMKEHRAITALKKINRENGVKDPERARGEAEEVIAAFLNDNGFEKLAAQWAVIPKHM